MFRKLRHREGPKPRSKLVAKLKAVLRILNFLLPSPAPRHLLRARIPTVLAALLTERTGGILTRWGISRAVYLGGLLVTPAAQRVTVQLRNDHV